MNSYDWERFGEEIRKTVQEAVENQDYKKMNQMISNTINQAADALTKGGYKNPERKRQSSGIQYTNVRTEENQQMQPPSRVGAILEISLGYSLGFFMLIFFVVFFIVGSVTGAGFHLGTGVFGILAAGFLGLGAAGTRRMCKINRFRSYVRTIGGREYCNVSELAGGVRKSDRYVIKDLESMIGNHWFLQGHLDRQGTCFMVTDKMYHQYCQLEQQRILEKQEEQKREEKEMKGQSPDRQNLPPEVQKVLEQGNGYIQKIHACNDAIPGEKISEKISRIEVLTDKILERVKQDPKCVPDLRKLMEYYLPTTVKLLEAYAQMDSQPAGGENIQTAKREIEATLDTLNGAFEKLLDDLFQETAWDVSSDISVLNTMLAQEGLKEDSLKGRGPIL